VEIISIPTFIESKLDKGGAQYYLTVAVIPPIVTLRNGNEMERNFLLNVNDEDYCRSMPKFCFTVRFGGIFIFKEEKPLIRFERRGYAKAVTERESKTTLEEVKRVLKSGDEGCLGKEPSICITHQREQGSQWIDNIGLRHIKGIR